MTRTHLPDDRYRNDGNVDASQVTPQHDDSEQLAIEALNRECFCLSLDTEALDRSLESTLGQPGLYELIRQRCPYLFAALPVFIANAHVERMAQVIRAIESVVALPAYQHEVLARASEIAHHEPGNRGVFYGYDFHLDQGRLGLIEINTNAGGAMLNAVLARAQRACCEAMEGMVPSQASIDAFERDIVAMFHREWRLAGRARALHSIAIVDEAPEQQYLYPEFVLFQRLFERYGLSAVIADPATLTLKNGVLWHDKVEIDLVYNRLTDFELRDPANATLREAYLQGSVVLTPHPRAHALYADKRNLALISDVNSLEALHVSPSIQALLLESVPRTEVVNAANAGRLWEQRRALFFKPVAGFGGRAAYRGDKLTHRVWKNILAGDYVAQVMVAPGQRIIERQDDVQALKFDVRNYAYNETVQWVAARLYQGQTTNFRTLGGGFAPVYTSADAQPRAIEGESQVN